MKGKNAAAMALLALVLASMPGLAGAAVPKAKNATCYVIVEEGASAEGNSLFLKMVLNSEALSLVAPTRFSYSPGFSLTRAEGSFSAEKGQPVLIERKGKLVLYSVAISYRVATFPKAFKTISIDLNISELAKTKDLVQPAARAIELAAAKAGLRSGNAWVLGMTMPNRSTIRVQVSLAK